MIQKIKALATKVVEVAKEKGAVLAAAPLAAVPAMNPASPVSPYNPYDYTISASTWQSLTINVNTAQLFSGAQLMIDALSNPYLFIAGLSLGVAILGAILAAVRGLRLG